MSLRKLLPGVGFLALVYFSWSIVNAQPADRIRETWKGPDAALIRSILKQGEKGKPSSGATKQRPEVVKFSPVGDSGVAKSLADACGRNEEEKAALAEVLGQIKKGYEAEVAKEGKSNNLAAAMTFFVTVSMAAYHQTDMPSDEAGETLFQALQETMASAPAFARMSNPEKQQMYDWLVCMEGFVLTNYTDAKQTGDKEGLKNFGELADYSMRLVAGVEVGNLSFAGNNLSIGEASGARQTAGATENKFRDRARCRDALSERTPRNVETLDAAHEPLHPCNVL